MIIIAADNVKVLALDEFDVLLCSDGSCGPDKFLLFHLPQAGDRHSAGQFNFYIYIDVVNANLLLSLLLPSAS